MSSFTVLTDQADEGVLGELTFSYKLKSHQPAASVSDQDVSNGGEEWSGGIGVRWEDTSAMQHQDAGDEATAHTDDGAATGGGDGIAAAPESGHSPKTTDAGDEAAAADAKDGDEAAAAEAAAADTHGYDDSLATDQGHASSGDMHELKAELLQASSEDQGTFDLNELGGPASGGFGNYSLQTSIRLFDVYSEGLGANEIGVAGSSIDLSDLGLPDAGVVYMKGTGAADTLTGHDGRNFIIGGAGADSLDGGKGDDQFGYSQATDIQAGETVEGGSGQDSIVLQAAGVFKLSDLSIGGVELLAYRKSGSAITAELSGSQIGAGAITGVKGLADVANVLKVTGSGIDLAGVTFTDWTDGKASIELHATGAVTKVIGSKQQDVLFLEGTLTGAAIDGGEGEDTIKGSADLSGVASFDNIERLLFDGTATTMTITSSQLASGVTKIESKDTDTSQLNVKLADAGGTFSLTGITFTGWSAADKIAIAGGAGADTVTGSAFADTITGAGGDDILNGGDGGDALEGGDGNDTLNGGLGADSLKGEAGNDALEGGDGNDSLDGGDGDDSLKGDGGNDTLKGSAGVDTLDGGDGDDALEGGDGNDTLNGGLGADSLKGDAGNDTLNGGDGADNLDGGDGDDALHGGDGNDTVTGGAGIDTIDGGLGNDTVNAGDGDDTLKGADGNDTLNGGAGFDTLEGGEGNDKLDGGNDHDSLDGGNGDDQLEGGEGNDALAGGGGSDNLDGGQGADNLQGGDGNDTADGGFGNDTILGGAGDDTLTGGSGKDDLTGGAGKDTMTGGEDEDHFIFSAVGDSVVGANRDIIADFAITVDKIDVSAIDANSTGGAADDAFTFLAGQGTAFTNTAGEIRFEFSGTNTLVQFDTNGDGTADFEIQLTGNIALTAGDFIL